jgi:hypothetical protein
MRPSPRILFALTWLLSLPAAVYAQATIAGVVRDSSGAVLPGVTVEAASPALIEKIRTAVTDGSGQYRIVDLRAGDYTVTFTLTGFGTLKREGIELTGTSKSAASRKPSPSRVRRLSSTSRARGARQR